MTLLFFLLLIVVFGKLFSFAIKASWGIFKLLVLVLFLPLLLIGFVIAGLMFVAFPILLIIGFLSLFVPRSR